MRVTEPYTIFLRTLSSGKKVYYYQFRDTAGHRSNALSTGCTKLTEAKRFCQRLYNSGAMKLHDGISFKDFTKDFFAADSDFCKWKLINGTPLKPETAKRYSNLLKGQLVPFFDKIPIANITKDLCKEWVLWASDKWAPKTVNTAQGVLNIIFENAIEKRLIDRNPVHKLGMRKTVKKSRDLLTVQEITAIYHSEWSIPQQRSMFLLAVITGMRIGEVVALHWQDIKDGYIDVHSNYSDKFGFQSSTKTYVNRYVPIPSDFPFPEQVADWVFTKKGKTPIKGHALYNIVKRKCADMGIDTAGRGITIHSLRNFFVSYLQKCNIPENKIRAVVGHTDETMTDLYTYWKPDMFPEVYDAQIKLYNSIIAGVNNADEQDN